MARALTPELRWAVERRYGTLDNAVDEALTLAPERCPELQELWDAYTHRFLGPDFWKVFWRLALPVLGIDAGSRTAAGHEKDGPGPRQLSTRGRTDAPVLEIEANKAARIYIRNRELTPYGVWVRYNPRRVKQKANPKLLSKNMIGHLVTAIDRGWLPWDAAEGRLISGEFRAGRGRIVIPRGKPVS